MHILLDTHILLWYLEENENLSVYYKQQIENKHNQISVSVASLWEMTIKMSLGKLELMDDILTIEKILIRQGINIVPILARHLQQLSQLPFYHRDPFDRIIIAQSLVENMTVISVDRQFSLYSLSLLSDQPI